MRRSVTIFFILIAVSLASAPAMLAQIVGGTISGTVKNAQGTAVAGATVTVRNAATGTTRAMKTGADGRFFAPSLPVGTYQVTVGLDGYTTLVREGVAIGVGQGVTVPFSLKAGSGREVVTGALGTGANVTTHAAAGVIGEGQVRDLPFDGRGYDQLITLNPATANYTNERVGGSGMTAAGVGNQYTVAGRRPQDNLFLLNGIEFTGESTSNITPGGVSGQILGSDSIQALNVNADTYSAAYGKRDGGQISIVTSSGTNNWHGDAYEFFRNNVLNARNYFDQGAIPQFQRNLFGASVGGPVRQSKVLFFANFEGLQQNAQLTDVTIIPDSQAQQGYVPNSSGVEKSVGIAPGVAPLLELFPAQNGPELMSGGVITGLAEAYSHPPAHVREDFGTARVDDNLGPKDLLFGVYTVDDSAGLGATANPLSQISQSLREQVASLQEQHVFRAALNTARIGYSRAGFFYTGLDTPSVPGWVTGLPVGAVIISGSTASAGIAQVTPAGNNVNSNNHAARNVYTADDHVFWTRGSQQFELGGWFEDIETNDMLTQNQYGQASFATLTSFLEGTVASFTIIPAPTEIGWRSMEGAAFVEDIWKATSRLELRGGFREESTNGWNASQGRASNYAFPGGVIADNPTVGTKALTVNNARFLLNPRAAFAWDVFGNGKTALRGGVGLYHTLLDALDYRLDQTAPYNAAYSVKGAAVSSFAIAPGSGAPKGGLITASTVQQDIKTPAVVSWRLRIEQQIAPRTTFIVGYLGSHSYHQLLTEDLNEPAPSYTPDGVPYYASGVKDLNPGQSKSTSIVSQGVGSYNALETEVRGNVGGGVTVRGAYTYSKNLDDGSAWSTAVSSSAPTQVEFPTDPKMDWGPATSDLRNSATVSATWALPIGPNHAFLANTSGFARVASQGWTVSGIETAQSGYPFTPQLGYNPTGNGDSRNPIRPDWNPAFTGPLYPRTPGEWFNPNAFIQPATGYFGNVKRDSLVGPGLSQFDFSVVKDTAIEQGVHIQFRTGFYNLLNQVSFRTPNEITYASATSTASPTGGLITATSTSARQIQFGLKISF
jgi:hypothetical protein